MQHSKCVVIMAALAFAGFGEHAFGRLLASQEGATVRVVEVFPQSGAMSEIRVLTPADSAQGIAVDPSSGVIYAGHSDFMAKHLTTIFPDRSATTVQVDSGLLALAYDLPPRFVPVLD
jgi:hypothetical protein